MIDNQYKELVNRILSDGLYREDSSRTVRRKCVFGHQLTLDVSEYFPLLQMKETPIKQIATELIWFLLGSTNIKYLVDKGCNIWNKDAYQYYLNNCFTVATLSMEEFIQEVKSGPVDYGNYTTGDLGPIYGKQWRAFGPTKVSSPGSIYETDQIARLIKLLLTDPTNTSMVVSAWNPNVIDEIALPACHNQFQVNSEVVDGIKYIDLLWSQRSVDVGLGLGFNVASYAILMHILGVIVDAKPRMLIGQLGNCHLYEPHIAEMEKLINLPLPIGKPKLVINHIKNTLDNVQRIKKHLAGNLNCASILTSVIANNFKPENFSVVGYTPHPKIKLEMYEKTELGNNLR